MALASTEVGSIEETAAIRLVAAHRCGDRDAFAEIVRSHYPSLLATARHRLGNVEDAKDAVQETLVRALVALDRFGDTGDWRLGAWLSTILVHVCADIPSRRRPTVPLSDWLIETCADQDPQPISDHVALAAVRRAIGELPEPQRRAFELRLVDGRPYDEVAGALGITEVNARARVRRARAALRDALGSTDAVTGAFAAVPFLLAGPVRNALRRVFAGAGDSARAAGSQTIASGAATTGSPAASAIAGTPVETGIQLITQVSATPLGQAVVASATSVPGKGSVVLGIVASLATAGGLSAPAVISGSTPAPPPSQAAAAPVAASWVTRSSSPSTGSSASSSVPAGTTAPAGTTTSGQSPIAIAHFAPPSWMTFAVSGGPYRVVASSTTTATAPAQGSTAPAGSSAPSAPPAPGAASSSSGAATPGTSGAGAPTTGTAASPPASVVPGPTIPLPIGTCTGVTGFPGVTAPSALPALSSSNLDAVLSTGSLGIATVGDSPAFAGTALVKTMSSTDPVHVKVGTCLADGGSILAVDLTGTTGDEVQLVGSLVSQPFDAATGADTYLFRGNVTQLAGTALPGGRLPWGLAAGFVAEVQVQSAAKTGSLSVVFGEPQSQGATTGTASATAPATTPATTPGTATAPAPSAGAGAPGAGSSTPS